MTPTAATRTRVLTGSLLIVMPLLFNLFFFLLQSGFDYPNILRQPAGEILSRFAVGGSTLIAVWYGFAMTSVLFIPTAILLRRFFPAGGPVLDLATPLAVLAGLVQVLGLIRWPFLVPVLARTYLDPAASEATRDATVSVFAAFHQYAGVAIGEHLGYLFTAAWTLVIAVSMLRSAIFPSWLGVVGGVSAMGILAGLLEPAGFAAAGLINSLAYIVWSLWLIGAGVMVLRSRNAAPISPEPVLIQGDPAPAVGPA